MRPDLATPYAGAHPAAPRVLLVCQTGPGIGLGHLARMRVAARGLHEAGLAPHLLVHGGGAPRADDPPRTDLPPEADLVAAIDGLLAEDVPGPPPATVLLDLAAATRPPELVRALERWRGAGRRLIGIDGRAEWRARLDGIFMPSFRRPPWLDEAPGTAAVVWGWDCLLLPATAAAPAWTAPSHPEVLVLTGGADATGLGGHWPRALDACLPAGCTVHWVRGPWAAAPLAPAAPRCDWHWHTAPDSLAPLMRRCSHAISVFGVSAFELLQHGVPTVVFSPYGGKDDAELAELAATGTLAVAGDVAAATDRLLALLADPAAAAALARRARTCGAGGGGARLARWLSDMNLSAATAA